MGFDLSNATGLHPNALKVRAERTKVLASNLANQNTPGYQAVDVDVKRSLAAAGTQGMGGGVLPAFDSTATLGFRRPNHASADGNTVELGVEQAAFAQNATDFQISLTFVNMKFKGLQSAITGNT